MHVEVRNAGAREGSDVPQANRVARTGRSLPSLVGLRDGGWHRPSDRCAFGIGHRDSALGLRVSVALPQRRWRP